jgi:hypothetical protein
MRRTFQPPDDSKPNSLSSRHRIAAMKKVRKRHSSTISVPRRRRGTGEDLSHNLSLGDLFEGNT